MIGAVGSSFCPENTQIELAWAGPCVGVPLPVISPAKAGAGIAVPATTIAAAISHFLMKPLLWSPSPAIDRLLPQTRPVQDGHRAHEEGMETQVLTAQQIDDSLSRPAHG